APLRIRRCKTEGRPSFRGLRRCSGGTWIGKIPISLMRMCILESDYAGRLPPRRRLAFVLRSVYTHSLQCDEESAIHDRDSNIGSGSRFLKPEQENRNFSLCVDTNLT